MTGTHRRPRGDDDIMTVPPRIDHTKPVPDSRGLVLSPAGTTWTRDGQPPLVQVPGGYQDETAPRASGLIQIAGLYMAAPDCEHTAPCWVCDTERPVVLTLARPVDGRDYAICPPQDNLACLDRGKVKLAAARAQEAAQAPAGEAAAKAKPAPKPRPKRPPRPSQAKVAALSEGAAKTAEAAPEVTTEPPEGGAA